MKYFYWCCCFLALFGGFHDSSGPADPYFDANREREKRKADLDSRVVGGPLGRNQKTVEAIYLSKNSEAFEDLASIIRSYGERSAGFTEDERSFFEYARSVMFSWSGYGDIFSNEIKQITEEDISYTGEYKNLQPRYFYYQVLEQLPSLETVKVLGEFLSDERDPWSRLDCGDCGPPQSNAQYAMEAFHHIGLKSPPVPATSPLSEGDIHTWQLWYEQIKVGTRTFSFVGDDRVYNLNGVVSSGGEADVTRAGTHGANQVAEAAKEMFEHPMWPGVAAVALLAAGAAVLAGSKKRSGV